MPAPIVASVRLLADLSSDETQKIELSLETGELSLTCLSQLQGVLVVERKTKKRVYNTNEKMELIASLKCKSSREAEKILATVSPDSMRRKEMTRALSATETLIRFTADEALMTKLVRAREVLSHRLPDSSMASLFNEMVNLVLKTADPVEIPVVSESTAAPKSKDPRYIPTKLKTKLFQKSGGCCEYVDPKTSRRCEAKSFLQVDHRKPVAFGGTAHEQNLMILCATHNQYAAWRLGIGVRSG